MRRALLSFPALLVYLVIYVDLMGIMVIVGLEQMMHK